MKKQILLLIILSTLMTGCITLRIETKINQDGSGTRSFVIALSKETMSMLTSMAEGSGQSVDNMWDEALASAETIPGAKVEEYQDDKSQGIRITFSFDTLEELEALSRSEEMKGGDQVTITEQGDQITLQAVIDTSDMTSGLSGAGEEMGGLDLSDLDIDIEYSYIIQVEGKIISYGPHEFAEVKGNKITWDLTQAPSDTTELFVTWKPGGGLNLLIILVIGAVVVCGLLVFLGIVAILVSRRRRKGGGVAEG